MSNANLHIVYRSVIVAKLLCAASAWYGFSTADGCRHRLEAVIRHSIRSGLCPTDQWTVSELVDTADESLFRRYCTTTMYYTSSFLSDVTAVMIYERQDRELAQKDGRLEREFVTRMLFKDSS